MLRTAAATVYFACVLALATAILTVACLLAACDRSGAASNAVIRGWARLLLSVAGIRVAVEGAGSLPRSPVVFAANHASALDIPVLFVGMPRDFRILYKHSLRHVPFLGWSLLAGRHVAVDRANPFLARRSLDAAARRIREATSVVVFPEGTRATGGRLLLPFKRGSFVLAIEAGVPVVPVSLVGVKPLMPRGLGSLRSGEVRVVIHAPIPTQGRTGEDAALLAEQARQVVVAGLRAAEPQQAPAC